MFEDIDLKFCAHRYSSAIALSHIVRFFENFDFEGEMLKKKKNVEIFDFFSVFKMKKIRDSSFVALLILRHLI